MNYDEFSKAIKQAEFTMRMADQWSERLARLLVTRLRRCNASTLKDLKRELREYNMHTERWKS